jgi:hypothetical protein
MVVNEMWFDMSVFLSIKRLNNNGVGGRGGRGYHSIETVIHMHCILKVHKREIF